MDVERRSLLKGLATGLAGAVVTSDSAAAESTATGAAQPVPAIAARDARARVLDDHQQRTLASLADLILPGSVAAGVVDLVDRVMAVEAPATQRRLLNALGQFDQAARDTAGVPWLGLTDAVRVEVLTRASTTPATTDTAPPALGEALAHLKATIGEAYASTEAGMRALGWTGRGSWSSLPACTHPNPEHE